MTSRILQLIDMLRASGPVILLESQSETHPASQKSYLAGAPSALIKTKGCHIEITRHGKTEKMEGNPWEALKAFRKPECWMFGYLSYDLKNHIEKLDSANPDLLGAPDMFFMIPEFVYEFSQNGEGKLISGEMPLLESSFSIHEGFSLRPKNRMAKERYIHIIEEIKKDIYNGEYYELNFTHPLEFYFEGDALSLYKKMKEVNPVPFAVYFRDGNLSICSSSPERFLAKRGNRVWSQPIKGTAAHIHGDRAEKQNLQASEKDRAENLMIVDLVRNDLNRFAIKNSVQVRDLFEIQSFETVHQMVSTVECQVDTNTDIIDMIKACFPMGSMTGAPKIAAMQAIEHYENYTRGIYSGAMGYITPGQDFDFNVMIRTAIIRENKLVYPVGGAITSDSEPEAEWEESLLKARNITTLSVG